MDCVESRDAAAGSSLFGVWVRTSAERREVPAQTSRTSSEYPPHNLGIPTAGPAAGLRTNSTAYHTGQPMFQKQHSLNPGFGLPWVLVEHHHQLRGPQWSRKVDMSFVQCPRKWLRAGVLCTAVPSTERPLIVLSYFILTFPLQLMTGVTK